VNTKQCYLIYRGILDNPVSDGYCLTEMKDALIEALGSYLTEGHRLEDDALDPKYPDLGIPDYHSVGTTKKKGKPRGRSVAKAKALG
jgi:hypothetical protein